MEVLYPMNRNITITNDINYLGVNDHQIDLFEGQYPVPNGISYNSYAILDEHIAVLDTVDVHFVNEWMANLQSLLGDRKPDYLIVHHMEPDHSAGIFTFMQAYPEAKIAASAKAFAMMKHFFGTDFAESKMVVDNGTTLSLGKHELTFLTAPMVHWPEVIMTYDRTEQVLFSADAFGKFGAWEIQNPSGHITSEDWKEEARRYYIGIVGKYGAQVQNLFKKASELNIRMICPLHGPVLMDDLDSYFKLYHIWSSYQPEEDGIVIAYSSVYGNTQKAALLLAEKLRKKGHPPIVLHDLSRCDVTKAVSDAFRYSTLVLASPTYNADVFPSMREYIHHLTERNFSNRTVAFIENGSWAPAAAKAMKGLLEKSRNLTYAENTVKILSALNEESTAQLDRLAEELSTK